MRQVLYEAYMDSVSDGLHERGGSRPVVLMAEVSSPQRTVAVQTAVNLDLQRNAQKIQLKERKLPVYLCVVLHMGFVRHDIRKAACF